MAGPPDGAACAWHDAERAQQSGGYALVSGRTA